MGIFVSFSRDFRDLQLLWNTLSFFFFFDTVCNSLLLVYVCKCVKIDQTLCERTSNGIHTRL